jgi:hypothetical protein
MGSLQTRVSLNPVVNAMRRMIGNVMAVRVHGVRTDNKDYYEKTKERLASRID